jgi:hypothetical protein
MKFCNRSEEVLDYLLGAMDASGRSGFEQHLASCPVCSAELALERSIEGRLRTPPVPPEELQRRIERAIAVLTRPRHQKLYRFKTAATVAAGFAAFISISWMAARMLDITVSSGTLDGLLQGVSKVAANAGANAGTLLVTASLTAVAAVVAVFLPGE